MTDFALPKSAKLVLDSLGNNPKTQKQILEKISLSPRTLRFAITRLKNLGLIKEINSLKDARIKFYKLKRR
ncbi:MAG: hypothetical protein J7L08_00435 [Candidatus Aenigmarchaeota archaeon]|nr:hypothetical protein [Candidatus Aenigmarchaeota archaeon]